MFLIDADADRKTERVRILREMIESRIEKKYVEMMLDYGVNLDDLFKKARKTPENPYLVDRRKRNKKAVNGNTVMRRRKSDW